MSLTRHPPLISYQKITKQQNTNLHLQFKSFALDNQMLELQFTEVSLPPNVSEWQ